MSPEVGTGAPDGPREADQGLRAGRCSLHPGLCPLKGKEPGALGDCETFIPTFPGRRRWLLEVSLPGALHDRQGAPGHLPSHDHPFITLCLGTLA